MSFITLAKHGQCRILSTGKNQVRIAVAIIVRSDILYCGTDLAYVIFLEQGILKLNFAKGELEIIRLLRSDFKGQTRIGDNL